MNNGALVLAQRFCTAFWHSVLAQISFACGIWIIKILIKTELEA